VELSSCVASSPSQRCAAVGMQTNVFQCSRCDRYVARPSVNEAVQAPLAAASPRPLRFETRHRRLVRLGRAAVGRISINLAPVLAWAFIYLLDGVAGRGFISRHVSNST
jgi:hypothetical protein